MMQLGIPYVWGGKSPLIGFDCSGLTQYLTSSVGLGAPGPLSSDGQYRYWLMNGVKASPTLGALVFFGSPERVHHIGMCMDAKRMVEAYNGTEDCINRTIAALKGAYVRVSSINRRQDLVACLLPPYETVF